MKTKIPTRQHVSRTRTKIALALITAATTLSVTACGGFAAQPVIKKSRCGTSSTSDRDPATLAGTSELKASGPITSPTKAGTTTQTSPFGPRWGTEHKGVDFAGPAGTPIYAALDGIAVKAGDHIANIGNAGGSTGPHLHFEYWEGGRLQGGFAIDPMTKLGGASSPADDDGAGSPNIALAASSSSIDCAGFGIAGGSDLKPASVPAEFEPWFRKAGSLCPQISPALLAADTKAESGFHAVTSPKGAKGYTQFMDPTWAAYGKDDDGNGTISQGDVGDAVMAQGRYFCEIARQVDGWIADGSVTGDARSLYIAGYNAGEYAIKNAGGMPSGGDYTSETQPYVQKVLSFIPEFEQPGGRGELVVSPSSASGTQVIEAARQYLGTPYVWGGGGIGGPTGGGFDCSGLTSYAIYTGSGNQVTLPRTSEQQWTVGGEIPINQAQPGDLVFGSWSGSGPGHVGIAIGNGQMIHAPTTGDVVKQAPLQNDMKARRVI